MIVIPMAGESRRFRDAGFTTPKYMLPLAGQTLFSWSIRSFERYFINQQFLFIILSSPETRAFVRKETKLLGIEHVHIVELAKPTTGQAVTVELGLKSLGSAALDAPITIFNIDTIRPGFSTPEQFDVDAVAGYLEVFRGPGEHWSFVEPADDALRVARTTEKERISDLCCTGLYYFESGACYAETLGAQRALPDGGRVRGEQYIAPMYNRLIEAGREVRYRLIESSEVEFSGTPEEYDNLQAKWELSPPAGRQPGRMTSERHHGLAIEPDASGDLDPFEALQLFADNNMPENAAPSELYQDAAKALIRSFEDGTAPSDSTYQQWSDEDKRSLLTRLLRQEGCEVRPNIFLHTICSFASSRVCRVMARELSPTLRTLVREAQPSTTIVVAVLMLRELLTDGFTQEAISEIHLQNFHRLSREDLSLPYTRTFYPDLFYRNREDIVGAKVALTSSKEPKLELFHLLLVEWLSGETLPTCSTQHQLLLTLEASVPLDGSGCSEFNLAAGRLLLARHLPDQREGDETDQKQLLERLDTNTGFGAMVGKLALARDGIRLGNTHKRASIRKWLLDHKAYQAAHVLKNEVRGRIGRRLSVRRRLRVALCVSGQLRGYLQAFETWQRKLLHGIDCDIYVHSWDRIGQSGAAPFRTGNVLPFDGEKFAKAYRAHCLDLSYEQVKARYPNLFSTLSEDGMVEESQLRALYGSEFIVLETEKADQFDGWSNSRKMHYKIHACSELALGQGREYDLVIRLRPDKPITYCGFGWRDILRFCRTQPRIFADNDMRVNYGKLMIGDQFAIGTQECMKIYASTYETYPMLVEQRLFNCPPGFRGHGCLACVCWLHGIDVSNIPIKWQPLLGPSNISSIDILKAVQHDANERADEWDQRLLSAIRRDLH
jgi:dTDP-glucose pyrophosphorylase